MKNRRTKLSLGIERIRVLSTTELHGPYGGDIGWSEYGGGGCGYTRTDDTGICCVPPEDPPTRGDDCRWSLRPGICPM